MVISFFSLGGMRQLSQGLYGMIRSLTACFSAEESTMRMRRTVLPDRAVSVFFSNRCTRPLVLESLYIFWIWMAVSCLSFTPPIAGMMWFSIMFS